MVEQKKTISVRTADASYVRRRGVSTYKELEIETLADNVKLFMFQIEQIMEEAPEEVGKGKFKLSELTVSAEVTGKGELALLGTGIEIGAQGGLTFTFKRK
jgi:hypothetical protein